MARRLLPALIGLALVGGTTPALAAPASLPDIEDEVMCPVCGVPLNQATEAPQAQRERALIRRLIAEGRSKDEIKSRLRDEFGPAVLALPERRGFSLAAYLVPLALIAGALALLATLLLHWRGPRAPGHADAQPESLDPMAPADQRRLDEDLARYDA